jgi:hypothetical protein
MNDAALRKSARTRQEDNRSRSAKMRETRWGIKGGGRKGKAASWESNLQCVERVGFKLFHMCKHLGNELYVHTRAGVDQAYFQVKWSKLHSLRFTLQVLGPAPLNADELIFTQFTSALVFTGDKCLIVVWGIHPALSDWLAWSGLVGASQSHQCVVRLLSLTAVIMDPQSECRDHLSSARWVINQLLVMGQVPGQFDVEWPGQSGTVKSKATDIHTLWLGNCDFPRFSCENFHILFHKKRYWKFTVNFNLKPTKISL